MREVDGDDRAPHIAGGGMTSKKKTSDDPRFDRLAELLRDTEPERLRQLLVKGSVVNFRCSEVDKQEIARVASECSLSVSEYLLRLHYFAAERLSKRARRT